MEGPRGWAELATGWTGGVFSGWGGLLHTAPKGHLQVRELDQTVQQRRRRGGMLHMQARTMPAHR